MRQRKKSRESRGPFLRRSTEWPPGRSGNLARVPGKERIARRGRLIVALPIAFQIIVLAAIAFTAHLTATAQEVHARAYDVLTSSYRLLSILVDAETGMRGFLLAGDRVFTEPYVKATNEYPREIERLRSVAGVAAVQPVERAAERMFAYHRANLALVDAGRREETLRLSRRHEGKALMDAFRAELARVVRDERQDVGQKELDVQGSTRLMAAALGIGFLANLIVAFGAAALFTRGISRRVTLLIDNTERFAAGEPLHPLQDGDDEIAQLDRHFHVMAASRDQARRQLESANAQLESFSYSVSHDLRAPVRALSGYAVMLEEDHGGVLDAEGRRMLGVIQSEATRLGTLIDELLAFSRLGNLPLRMATVNVGELAADVVREVCGRTGAATIEPMPLAGGDPALLRHVLTNLVSNAVKFSAPKGIPQITIGGQAGEAEHTYWVRDRGVGFDARYAEKLFGVFQRLHDAAEFEGTGVGLAIVKRIVDRHGGRVWAESAPGEGATFFFTLPDAKQDHE